MKNPFYTLPIILLFAFTSCKNGKDNINPEFKDITESVYASGIIKSKNQYEIYSKTNGILENTFVKEGMRIKKGDSLFKIENKSAEISVDNARLTSETNDFMVNTQRLDDAWNAIQLAEKKLINDSMLYYRQKKLWSNEIGSLVELEQRELNFENAKVNLARTKMVYDDLKRQLKLASGISKNNLKMAKSTDEDLIIRSLTDGVVYKINKEQGEWVSNLSALAVIGADDFILELNIDELDIVKIKPGQKVIVRMDSYKSKVFEAIISSIDPMMNERTRTFRAEAVFTQKPVILYPNLTLEANIIINTKQKALTIPRNYLLGDTAVILENGTIQKIETGLMDYNLVEVISGIDPDSKISLPKK
ncbi:MAG: efflux RND transporter periplasmic adaptor subunit [Flavobacteriales bacterium]|nr:efflux RND transporter periplasmic adaptor subunit [Flavobacteriales bacterium]